jgi:hypothetical protein
MSCDNYNPELQTLERGLGGCHGHGLHHDGNTYTISMYDSRLSCYYGDLAEGGFVIDKKAVLETRPGLAVSSPLCDPRLTEDEVDRLADHVTKDSFLLNTFCNEPDSGFHGVACLAKASLASPDKEPGAFDHVSPAALARWWASRGARVGKRQGSYIVWNNGDYEAIRPAVYRYKLANGQIVTE